MEAETRRVIAFIAGKLKVRDTCAAVYDHDERKQFSFTGIVRPEHISVYDFIRKCHVGGKRAQAVDNPDYFSLYDFGNGRHLTLSFDGPRFTGFDHKTSKPFFGLISGDSVSIHDSETDRDFYYSVYNQVEMTPQSTANR